MPLPKDKEKQIEVVVRMIERTLVQLKGGESMKWVNGMLSCWVGKLCILLTDSEGKPISDYALSYEVKRMLTVFYIRHIGDDSQGMLNQSMYSRNLVNKKVIVGFNKL